MENQIKTNYDSLVLCMNGQPCNEPYPSLGEWISKLCYEHTMEYYFSDLKKEVLQPQEDMKIWRNSMHIIK